MAKLGSDNAIVSVTSGATGLVVPRKRDDAEPETQRGTTQGGLIYTDTRDMPSLEQLLAQHRIATAIIEREVPSHVAPIRVMAATTLAAVVTAVGAALLAVDLAAATHPNPYVSLLMLLGGLGLFATILTALRYPRR